MRVSPPAASPPRRSRSGWRSSASASRRWSTASDRRADPARSGASRAAAPGRNQRVGLASDRGSDIRSLPPGREADGHRKGKGGGTDEPGSDRAAQAALRPRDLRIGARHRRDRRDAGGARPTAGIANGKDLWKHVPGKPAATKIGHKAQVNAEKLRANTLDRAARLRCSRRRPPSRPRPRRDRVAAHAGRRLRAFAVTDSPVMEPGSRPATRRSKLRRQGNR